jgi:hypothetical protein
MSVNLRYCTIFYLGIFILIGCSLSSQTKFTRSCVFLNKGKQIKKLIIATDFQLIQQRSQSRYDNFLRSFNQHIENMFQRKSISVAFYNRTGLELNDNLRTSLYQTFKPTHTLYVTVISTHSFSNEMKIRLLIVDVYGRSIIWEGYIIHNFLINDEEFLVSIIDKKLNEIKLIN